jgi:hypothetical protein
MDFAKEYLDAGPPYAGDSKFGDKERVKQLGARWGDDKKWVAHTHEVLKALIESRLWTPCGLGSLGAADVVNLLYKMQETPTHAPGGKMRFDRRDPEDSVLDPQKDRELTPNGKMRVYARKCDGCGVLLDSRLQFGLECDCEMGCAWKACHSCAFPLHCESACPLCK